VSRSFLVGGSPRALSETLVIPYLPPILNTAFQLFLLALLKAGDQAFRLTSLQVGVCVFA
jgi:hypothetical protein